MDNYGTMELDIESNFDGKESPYSSQTAIETILRLREETDVSQEEKSQWIIDRENKQIEYPLKQNKKGKLECSMIVNEWNQRDLYNICMRNKIMKCLDGLNFSLMAYGPSRTGKTHTILGSEDLIKELLQLTEKGGILSAETQQSYGIFPRAVFDVFDQVASLKD